MIDLIDPEIREALERIVKYEEAKEQYYQENPVFEGYDAKPYWEMMQVPVEWKHVRKFVLAGLVEKFGKKYYMLTDREGVKQRLVEHQKEREAQGARAERALQEELPADLFDIIESYDDLKAFFRLTLKAENPVHCLMIGAPGTAKSLFLMELERLGGRFITAGTATKVGIRDILYDDLPPILLIDEIDKISSSGDLSSLLTWMEEGRIIITKHGLKDSKQGKGWVFAAANTMRGLPPELLDRFQVFYIQPYSDLEFMKVVTEYLRKRMGVDDKLSIYITVKSLEVSKSVRQAIRVAKLAKTEEEVDDLLGIIKKYGG